MKRPRQRSRQAGRAPRAALPSGRCGPRQRMAPPLHGHLPGCPHPSALHAASFRWPRAPAAALAQPARPCTRAPRARARAAPRRPPTRRARRADRRPCGRRRVRRRGCRRRRPPRRAPRRPPRPAAAGPARRQQPGPGSTPGARPWPPAQTLPQGFQVSTGAGWPPRQRLPPAPDAGLTRDRTDASPITRQRARAIISNAYTSSAGCPLA